MEILKLQTQHLDLWLNMNAMMSFYCVDQRTEHVNQMDHGQDHYQSVSVSVSAGYVAKKIIKSLYRNYCNIGRHHLHGQ